VKIHRNIALGIVEGLQQILVKNEALLPCLNRLLKQNRKWGSRDRRQLGEAVLDCIRWKRTYEYLGNLNTQSENYYWELLGIWILTKKTGLPEWEEIASLKKVKIELPLDLKNTDRKTRESLPDWLDELGIRSFDEDTWNKESQSLNKIAPLVLRANTLKNDPLSLLKCLKKDFNIKATQSTTIPEALILEKHQKLSQNPIYLKGGFEIQDTNSQQVAHWTNPQPGNLVVDACAGSGGKSLHLAAIMKNKGKIIAFDPHQNKLDELQRRAKRSGVSNIQISTIDDSRFYTKLKGTVDIVLIDAPCSGLGVLKRNPAAKWQMNPERIGSLEQLQQQILEKNAVLVKNGGALLYATCSIFPNENQDQISRFLRTEVGSVFTLEKEQSFLTHQTGFDGFYIARLKKNKY
jgi:16S rRNA (cytosine967-C5)-methyltransferase